MTAGRGEFEALGREFKDCFGHMTPEEVLQVVNFGCCPSDDQIQACVLMIKGICMTRPQDVWMKDIEARIRFMLLRDGDKLGD